MTNQAIQTAKIGDKLRLRDNSGMNASEGAIAEVIGPCIGRYIFVRWISGSNGQSNSPASDEGGYFANRFDKIQ